MYTTTGLTLLATTLLSLLTATTVALPTDPPSYSSGSSGSSDTFNLHVYNQCPETKQFALYQITDGFTAVRTSNPVSIASNSNQVIPAPYTQGNRMRLSGHAESDNLNQPGSCNQTLFEFNYATWSGTAGTAYDISLMLENTIDPNVGLQVTPIDNGNGSGGCECKTCSSPSDCPADQGWTSPNQITQGSPADTGCYNKGPTDFKIVWCPSATTLRRDEEE